MIAAEAMVMNAAAEKITRPKAAAAVARTRARRRTAEPPATVVKTVAVRMRTRAEK